MNHDDSEMMQYASVKHGSGKRSALYWIHVTTLFVLTSSQILIRWNSHSSSRRYWQNPIVRTLWTKLTEINAAAYVVSIFIIAIIIIKDLKPPWWYKAFIPILMMVELGFQFLSTAH